MIASVSGDAVLRTTLAVEILGGGKDPGTDDGSGCRCVHGDREKNQEEAHPRLPVGKSEVSQLVGLQILPLRGACSYQRYR